MKIMVNGESENIDEGATVLSLLEAKGVDPKTVIVELDGEIHKCEDFGGITLKEDSTVEVLRFVGGG